MNSWIEALKQRVPFKKETTHNVMEPQVEPRLAYTPGTYVVVQISVARNDKMRSGYILKTSGSVDGKHIVENVFLDSFRLQVVRNSASKNVQLVVPDNVYLGERSLLVPGGILYIDNVPYRAIGDFKVTQYWAHGIEEQAEQGYFRLHFPSDERK